MQRFILSRRLSVLKSSEKTNVFSWWWSLFKSLTLFCKDISCQYLQRFIFPRWWSVLSTPVLPWPHCSCHQLDRRQSTCWGQVQDWWQLMPTIHENQQVMGVDHYCRMMTLDDNQQMKKIVASTSDASTRLVIRLLPKCLPRTTAVSHRCKMKYVHRIKVNINVPVFLLSGLACLLAGPCWWAGGLCREVFPKRALEALESIERKLCVRGLSRGLPGTCSTCFYKCRWDGLSRW